VVPLAALPSPPPTASPPHPRAGAGHGATTEQLVRVAVGLDHSRGADAFPGASACTWLPPGSSSGAGGASLMSPAGRGRTLPNLTECRARCLAGGFGGFAVDLASGAVSFRSGSPASLARALRPAASPSTTDFFLLTVRVLERPSRRRPSSSGRGGGGGAAAGGSGALDVMPVAPPLELWKCPPPREVTADTGS
jgi:hypothetical protein